MLQISCLHLRGTTAGVPELAKPEMQLCPRQACSEYLRDVCKEQVAVVTASPTELKRYLPQQQFVKWGPVLIAQGPCWPCFVRADC